MGEEMGNEAGLGAAGCWREVRGVVEVELGEVNSRWQYLIRYSVTTAAGTTTPWKNAHCRELLSQFPSFNIS